MAITFAKTRNGKIIYDGIKMELFVPDSFFKDGLAEMVGSQYYIYGNAITLHYTNKDDDDRAKAKKFMLYYPAKFYTAPTEVLKTKLDFGNGLENYTVLVYYNGDSIMSDDTIIKDAGNVSVTLKMITEGKMSMIEYAKIPRMLQISKEDNGVSFDAPAMYEEAMISEYYRDPENLRLPARFAAAATTKKHFYARGISQREKVSLTSTFAASTFEDIVMMITISDNAKRSGHKEIISDVEKVTLSSN